MSDFEKRVQINKIIESQLPEFIVSDFPKATEFFNLLQENEFFNFDMRDGEFRTGFTFENLTGDEQELINDLFESLL